MNLSLHQLLATKNESESGIPGLDTGVNIGVDIAAAIKANVAAGLIASQAANQPIPATRIIYDPSRIAGKSLHQASYRQARFTQNVANTLGAMTFSATVLANTLGFLALISGLLMLIQIAQVSLG